jgi:hypothetical protein
MGKVDTRCWVMVYLNINKGIPGGSGGSGGSGGATNTISIITMSEAYLTDHYHCSILYCIGEYILSGTVYLP